MRKNGEPGRWLFTAQVIAAALVPGRVIGRHGLESAAQLTWGESGYLQPAPETLLVHLGDLRALVDGKLHLRLFIKECLAPAAPFLLFRLKRQGFSRCRAEAAREGIYLSAEV
ncbi:hypothetical protein [Geotalea sp. SG265]|uniref:hypothetical protein n=1 Tax=Geotalea sp. SG265 TaxID=2922867 RepID=UPI001FAF7ED2|nr:hypothetical protein [Geotalea sp. SG265]